MIRRFAWANLRIILLSQVQFGVVQTLFLDAGISLVLVRRSL